MTGHRRRLKRINDQGQARYLTCSCFRRLPLLGNPDIRDAFMERLVTVQEEGGFDLYAWVIMPEHFHLLVLPHDGQVSTLLRKLKIPLARQVIARWQELQAGVLPLIRDAQERSCFWQRGGGYDRNIISDHELKEKIDYIHANPIQRGLVKKACDWKWSSTRVYAGATSEGPKIISPW